MAAPRLTPAGLVWLGYAAVVAAVVASCSGCATTAPAAAAPATGMRCQLGAAVVVVGTPVPMVDGTGRTVAGFAVHHPDPWGAWFARADKLTGCQA